MQERHIVLCDFDGTLTMHDGLATINSVGEGENAKLSTAIIFDDTSDDFDCMRMAVNNYSAENASNPVKIVGYNEPKGEFKFAEIQEEFDNAAKCTTILDAL